MVLSMSIYNSVFEETVHIDTGLGSMLGYFSVPERAWGAVVFADGCGSEGHELRDPELADSLLDLGLATLTVDLLKLADDESDTCLSKRRFDFRLMTSRLHSATDWVNANCQFADRDFRIGYVGTSLGAAAALRAAAQRSDVAAVVSCGGRPDLAGDELRYVTAATLMIVGDLDDALIEANQLAYEHLTLAYRREVAIIPQATRAFDENEAMADTSKQIRQWFVRYLGAASNRMRQL
jgi:dienelactone hydrolase